MLTALGGSGSLPITDPEPDVYLPDQQLPQIKPTFPPIFLANTRAAIERTSLLAVNLISGVIDVPSSHVPVMGTDRDRSLSALRKNAKNIHTYANG